MRRTRLEIAIRFNAKLFRRMGSIPYVNSERLRVDHVNEPVALIRQRERWKDRSKSQLYQAKTSSKDRRLSPYHDRLEKCTKVDQALAVLEELKTAGLTGDVQVYNRVLNLAAKGKSTKLAISLLNEMFELDGLWPNVVNFNTVLNACRQGKDLNTALTVFDRMKEEGVWPDEVSYATMISLAGELEIPERPKAFPEDRINLAEALFEEMIQQGNSPIFEIPGQSMPRLKPNFMVFGALLGVLSKAGRWERCLEIQAIMGHHNVKLNQIHYLAIISACIKGEDPQRALDIFAEAEEHLELTAECYNAAMQAHLQLGDFKGVQNTFKQLESRRVPPTMVSFGILGQALARGGMVTELRGLIEHMQCSLRPDVPFYKGILHEFMRAGDMNSMLQFFEDGYRRGVLRVWTDRFHRVVDLHLYNGAAACCAVRQALEERRSRRNSQPLIFIVGRKQHSSSYTLNSLSDIVRRFLRRLELKFTDLSGSLRIEQDDLLLFFKNQKFALPGDLVIGK